jgi:protein TonB
MTITTKKNTLFAGFLSIGTIIIMASCSNDSSSADKSAAMADTTTKVSADTTATTKMVAKKRKGMASGTLTMDDKIKMEKDKEGIYSRAEKMPEYPGGQAAISKFVENNINYPQDAIDQNTEGTVNVSFVVDEKGKVMNPSVAGKSIGSGLDQEAIKVVQQMPEWKPGLVKGKPVKTRLSLPVTFKLAGA